jgi:hypothetical protein
MSMYATINMPGIGILFIVLIVDLKKVMSIF